MKTKYTPFTILKGTNDHVVRVRVNKPRARAGVALVLITLALSLGLYVLASDILRLYIIPLIHKSQVELASFVNTLQIKTEDSGFYMPITKSYADELMHQQPDIPELTKQEIVENAKHGDIIIRVWNNETSQGKNATSDPTALHIYCRRLGKTNEFGYDPQDKKCFDTFQKSVDTVNAWFGTCLKTNTLGECLMRYSGNSESYIPKFINQ